MLYAGLWSLLMKERRRLYEGWRSTFNGHLHEQLAKLMGNHAEILQRIKVPLHIIQSLEAIAPVKSTVYRAVMHR